MKLVQIGKVHSNNKILLETVAKNWGSIVVLSIEHFSFTPLC